MGEIKNQAITGVFWSAIERFSSLFIQIVCTLIIARFLTPSDFGTVGMLTIFTAIAQCLVDSGFKTALIRKSDVNDTDYSSVLYFNIVFSILLYAILFFLSPAIARFYDVPILERVSKVTFLVIPISSIGIVQGAIIIRKVNFKLLTRVSLIAASISGAIGVFLAYKYQSLWALVVQNLLFYSLQSILLWVFAKWRPILSFSLSSIKSMFGFSVNIMLSSLIGTVFNNLYGLVIGKIYTPSDLGNYSQAHRLQSLSSSTVTEVVQRVSYPVLTKFQNNDALLREAYKKIIGTTFLVVCYMMFLLMGVSTPLFSILFNDEWVLAGKFFAILCFNGIFYPLHSVNLSILTAKGKGKTLLFLEITRRTILIAILFVTSSFNIEVFVWGQVIYSLIVLFINMPVCGHCIGLGLIQQIKELLPTFVIGAIAMVVIKFGIFFISSDYLLIAVQLCIGLSIMIALSVLTKNQYFSEVYSITRSYIDKFFHRTSR